MSQTTIGALSVALSAVLYGSLGYIGTMLMRAGESVGNMLFLRSVISFFSILLIIVLTARVRRALMDCFREPRALIFALIMGGAFYAVGSEFFFLASFRIGTGLGMVIFFSYPGFVILLDWIFHRKAPTPRIALCLAGMLAGLICLSVGQDANFDLVGIAYGVLAAFGYAVYLVASKKQTGKLDSMVSTLAISAGNTIFFVALAGWDGTLSIPPLGPVWIWVIALGTIATSIPILLMLKGLERIDTARASIISALEPVTTLILGTMLLGEHLLLFQQIGVVLMIVFAICAQV